MTTWLGHTTRAQVNFLSLFSGIEAASVAWHELGWRAAGFSEIDAFPCAVLAHHYPTVPNLGDVSKITKEQVAALGRIDLVCGGFPCQDLSEAGKRTGLTNDDGSHTRSGLFFDAMRVVGWTGARWLVIENVPGMLSSNAGRDFAAVVGAMAGCGFDVPEGGWANSGVAVGPLGLVEWATLDAQFFGLAQRRKRVFLVRDSGDWASRAPVLLERESLRGDPAPRREAGQSIAPTIAGCSNGGGANGPGRDVDSAESLIPERARAPTTSNQRIDAETETFIVAHTLKAKANSDHRADSETCVTTQITSAANYSNPKAGDPCHPLAAGAHAPAIAFGWQNSASQGASASASEHHSPTLDKSKTPGIQIGSAVRRLTPKECERLQGFPDVEKTVTILVCCSDHQKNSALAEIRSLRSQNSAFNAVARASKQRAKNAAQPSHINLLGHDWPVALHVQIDYGRGAVRISSQGRLLWFASNAASPSSSPLPMPAGDFVRLAALTMGCLVPITQSGWEDVQSPSTSRVHGSAYAALSVDEMRQLASDAEQLSKTARAFTMSTTSPVPPSSPSYEQTLQTWSCCVAAAIASCIPGQMRKGSSFALSIEAVTEYLDITYCGKPAADGPKYRALGNSWAVPVARWIGRRIEMVDAIKATTEAAA